MYLLTPGNDESDIVNITAMAVVEAQHRQENTPLAWKLRQEQRELQTVN